jgi:peptidoglycan/xylan/chitin deacetylase (PgdA/CDA1 family)
VSALVLAWHRVADPVRDPFGLCTPPDRFRAQLSEIARRSQPLPLDELTRRLLDGSLPPRAVALTVDDGYVDALEVASPLLAAAGMEATFFVTGFALERAGEYWWDALARVLDGEALRETHARLLHAGLEEREREVHRLLDAHGMLDAPVPARPLLAGELRALAARHAVGAHSMNHLWLPALGPDERAREIADGKRAVEAIIGRPSSAFAYPFGACDEACVEEVREQGFQVAVTCEEASVRAGADPLRLPRRQPPVDGFADWLERELA